MPSIFVSLWHIEIPSGMSNSHGSGDLRCRGSRHSSKTERIPEISSSSMAVVEDVLFLKIHCPFLCTCVISLVAPYPTRYMSCRCQNVCLFCTFFHIILPKKRITRNHTQPSRGCERHMRVCITLGGIHSIIASPVHIIDGLVRLPVSTFAATAYRINEFDVQFPHSP